MHLLLIQCRTDASAPHEHACVSTHAGLDVDAISVVNPVTHPGSLAAQRIHEYDAVILGGSGEFCITQPTAFQGAVDEIRPFLDEVLRYDHPFLGMCLGHQVLAWHLGARVLADPNQSQVGSFTVTVTEDGRQDPLFADMPERFTAQHGHKDSVDELPAGARHLTQGERNRVSGYRIGERVYGLQFHPELTLDDLMTRLELYPEYLKGRSIAEARKDFQESPQAPRVLRNFFTHVVPAHARAPQVMADLIVGEVPS